MIILTNDGERRRIEQLHRDYDGSGNQIELNKLGVSIKSAPCGADCAMHTLISLGLPGRFDLMDILATSEHEISHFREFQPGENYFFRYYNRGQDEPYFLNTAVHLGGDQKFWNRNIPLVESKWDPSLPQIVTHPIALLRFDCGNQYRVFHFGDIAKETVQAYLRANL